MKPQYGSGLLKTTAWCLREHVADNRNLSSEGNDKIYLKLLSFNNIRTPRRRWPRASSLIEKETMVLYYKSMLSYSYKKANIES
jgi:hypothetical protein